jgi:uncharacterized protein YycO
MIYKEIRNKIRSGDVLAWSHSGVKSWYDLQIFMVRLFTRSEYSHVGIAWVVAGRVFVIEAVSSGVRIYPLSLAGDFYHVSTDVKFDKGSEEVALSKIGEKYSKIDAINAFIGKLKIGEGKSWECAEYVLFVLEECGIKLEAKPIPSDVVFNLLMRGGKLTFVENK